MMNTKYICRNLESAGTVPSEKINEFNERIEGFLLVIT